eukprot:TRINITY_DN1044_c0_g1_i2.p2 TRINITY_DN1044_c0_g1~~TRINITY_DN1044_c0_g1_i2.p2  ORF type:complete len:135 (-),score=35.53 TRINITY_DN1044_c0_g1_i2:462-866(-)
METRGFISDERPTVRFVDSEELAYVMARYREVHDFWHVLSGLDTSVLDEVALKYFEFLQTGLPMCALSGLFGPLAMDFSSKVKLVKEYLPWVTRLSQQTPFLMNIYYEQHLTKPISLLRKEWGFTLPPPPANKQ